jgi:nanoRNase/pAp phosphatase (c-di-AMP/oligoRNAs hydrolase)
VIALPFNGGGHRQAAGFSTDLPLEEIVQLIREGFLAQRATSRA